MVCQTLNSLNQPKKNSECRLNKDDYTILWEAKRVLAAQDINVGYHYDFETQHKSVLIR